MNVIQMFCVCWDVIGICIKKPLPAKLAGLNFHPLEVVSRDRLLSSQTSEIRISFLIYLFIY